MGRFIESRLAARGPSPYSLCEARLSPQEFTFLQEWARSVPQASLYNPNGYTGLVFFAFIAEWNRRHSRGGTVYQGLAEQFGNPETRDKLFTERGDARGLTRDLIRRAAERFHLRHVFDEEHQDNPRWYLTIQLQYGFSWPQCQENLPDWLSGHPVTEAMCRLLEPEGRYRSRSFQRLLADLKYLRRDYLSEIDLRRTLQTNPWVLKEWVEEIIELARRPGTRPSPQATVEEPEILKPPRIEWDSGRGPYAVCQLFGLDRLLPTAPRYHLRQDGRLLASWFRQQDGTYFADREEIELSLASPEVVIRLEDSVGEALCVQTLALWSPAEEVQAWPLGRIGEPAQTLEPGRAYVLMIRDGFRLSESEAAWWRLGRGQFLRRCLLIGEAAPDLEVHDADENLVWQARLSPIPAGWLDQVRIDWEPRHSPIDLGAPFRLTFDAPAAVRVEYAHCNGEPVTFEDDSRRRTRPLRLSPELAFAGVSLRVGLSRDGARTVLRRTLSIPTRGLAVHVDASGTRDGCCWQQNDPQRRGLSVSAATSGAFRAFTDGPNALLEGNVFHRRVSDRPHPLGRLLGTGGGIRLADQPYNTLSYFPIAAHAIDFGVVHALSPDPDLPDGYRLRLLRSIFPTRQHNLILWSIPHGVECLGTDRISCADEGRVWQFSRPWVEATGCLLCGVSYEGHRLGFDWQGDWHPFFSPEPADHLSLTPRQRLALLRWFRLPGLMGRPALLLPLAQAQPAELLAVALFDQGLESLPAQIHLEQEEAATEREQFDTIVREVLFDFRPSHDEAESIQALFRERSPDDPMGEMIARLFPYHPILAARVLSSGWLASVRHGQRTQARQDLRRWRLAFAGVGLAANFQHYNQRCTALFERAKATLGDGTDTVDDYLIKDGIVKPAIQAIVSGQVYHGVARDNLLVALGSAAFRYYLGLRLLDELESRL
jgi:hypothetical protein